MKRDEIVTGGTYSNGKPGRSRRRRRVIGDADSRSPRQKDDDEVQYIPVFNDGAEGAPISVTRAAFAKWAAARVDAPAADAEARG